MGGASKLLWVGGAVGDSLAGAHSLMLTGLLPMSGMKPGTALSIRSAQACNNVVDGR